MLGLRGLIVPNRLKGLYAEEPDNLYSLRYIVKVIKSRTVRCVADVLLTLHVHAVFIWLMIEAFNMLLWIR
jgi:hypothetical protein